MAGRNDKAIEMLPTVEALSEAFEAGLRAEEEAERAKA